MRVAIIGASGFVGTRLLERFHLGRGPTPVALVREPSDLALPCRFAIETQIADALDTDAMARAFSGCSAVIHVAEGDLAQIERMPAALCLAATAAGVRRLVYLSSASVHGQCPPAGTDETSTLHARQALDSDRARTRAEQSFFIECQRYALSGFALRPGVIYGPRSPRIADLATDLIEGQAWLYDGGRGICNAIYVDNLVHAIECCLRATDDVAGPYLVGDNDRITWEQFYRAAARHLEVPWENIHQLTQLPLFRRSWTDRAERAAAHPLVQRLLPRMPEGLKRSTRAVVAAARMPRSDAWALPTGPRPRITQEMALLQQCSWPLPYQRAEQQLDYRPPVRFAEGIERSFAWWRFAQGEAPFAA